MTAILVAGCGAAPRQAMKSKPELRQLGTLKPEDFTRHPVWVQCHVVDSEEAWNSQTDEETFRPWTGGLPVEPQHGMFLVRATFDLADGTILTGFVTPSASSELGTMQPSLFTASGQRVAFWLGMFPRLEECEAAYSSLAKTASQVFPIRFAADVQLSRGVASGTLEGFYSIPEGKLRVDK